MKEQNLYLSSLFGGGMAGLIVDVSLFPLDTIKTRLQSPQGFVKAGGFNGVYRGLGPQVIGSAPQAALFFLTYESIKHYSSPKVTKNMLPLVHMSGACVAEVVACLIRVPMEVVKQRRQTIAASHSSWKIAMHAYQSEGVIKGLYRGFGSMVIREIPFSLIQFPILEYLKTVYRTNLKNNKTLEPWEVANCGAIAGGISAAVTTPLDVVKTRIMLADRATNGSASLKYSSVWNAVYREKGVRGLFAGFVPRVIWITIGGYIFFGAYDFSKTFCSKQLLGECGS